MGNEGWNEVAMGGGEWRMRIRQKKGTGNSNKMGWGMGSEG